MDKYFVYYNLHKHVFSCKNWKTKLVNKDMYSTTLFITDCEFKVSEKDRQRVIKEKRKNVHAGIVGQVEAYNIPAPTMDDLNGFHELTYNPYKYSQFVVKSTGANVYGASEVYLINKKIYAKNIY